METHRIAVFDVCGTLTRTNNTFDFIGFVLRKSGIFRYALFILIRILISLCGFPGMRRIVSQKWLRARQIALLQGYSAVRLQELATAYADALFAKGLLNERIVRAMQQEREQGRAVVLASSAIDPPIAAIARRLNVRDFVSSELEIVDGRCTGRLRADLLGCKQAALERLAANVNLGDSSVYSDNPEDAVFMQSFARRYVVLNTSAAERMWGSEGRDLHFIRNYEAAGSGRDVDSINEKTVRWVYIPTLYYILSRFHRTGLVSLCLREIIPVTLAIYLFTSLGASSFILMPLSFLMFYSVYEIGGAINDLWVNREQPGVGTRRISPGVRVRMAPFIAVRIAVVAALLAALPATLGGTSIYVGFLCLCVAIYLLHSAAPGRWRIVTFILLKACRDCIPLAILASRVPSATLAWLCAVFFVMDAPWRVYAYCLARGLLWERIAVWRMRCIQVTVLCAVGAAIYVVAGIPHLLAVALYNAVLECLGIVRMARRRSSPVNAGSVARSSLGSARPPSGRQEEPCG
jgi:phosphoserine phosphatase